MLRNRALHQLFEAGWRPFPSAIILGDSAYPCKDWLIPPIRVPRTEAENRFNAAHKSTRSVIERSFGLLKNRFAVLATPLRDKSPDYACEIVKCCTALHNLCIQFMGVPDDIPYQINDVAPADDNLFADNENIQRRQQLINFFAN